MGGVWHPAAHPARATGRKSVVNAGEVLDRITREL